MSVPDRIRKELKRRLASVADSIDWMSASPADKAKHYDNWIEDPEIGEVLSRYIDKSKVRLYIKDSLLKDYARTRLADGERPLRVVGISPTVATAERYIKPHGRRLADGRVICWGRAEEWKTILMALHERSYLAPDATPFAAILTTAAGRFNENASRTMVEDAAKKLGIARLIWLES